MFVKVKRVKQFEAQPEAELLGVVFLSWTTNILAEETRPLLPKYGLTKIEPETWYNAQIGYDLLREVVDSNENVMSVLVALGKAVVDQMPLSDFETIEAFKDYIEMSYSATTRNHPEYEKAYLEEHDGELYLLNNTPAANDLIYGMWSEILRRYTIAGNHYMLIPHKDYPSHEIGSIFKLKLR